MGYMNLTELQDDLQKTIEDNKRLKSVERELEKARLALNRAEQDNLRLREKVSRIRNKSKSFIDQLDEAEMFQSHVRLRFTSHINGVRALHVKALGHGKMFTSRDHGDDISLLGKAVEYLRNTAWSQRGK